MSFDVIAYLDRARTLVDRYAEEILPTENHVPGVLMASMRYSYFAGGKRFRPALCFAACEAVSGDSAKAVPFALALEMIHTYSLIHDDLPAMDDDALRRGMPTNHVKFGEGIAILAGDALLTDAFALLTRQDVARHHPPEVLLRVVREIAQAAGSGGMVGGQALDLISEGYRLDLPTLEFLHIRKTGALIRASVLTGGLAAGADAEQESVLRLYADRLGLAFQIADDILDVEGKTEVLGKPVGSDEGLRKATYPALLGMAEAKRRLAALTEEAVERLSLFGTRGEPLKELARFVASRDR